MTNNTILSQSQTAPKRKLIWKCSSAAKVRGQPLQTGCVHKRQTTGAGKWKHRPEHDFWTIRMAKLRKYTQKNGKLI